MRVCPSCGGLDFVVHSDVVDLDVGMEIVVYGLTCKVCGDLYLCPFCGQREKTDALGGKRLVHKPRCEKSEKKCDCCERGK